jgi:hypothetical protein
MRFARIVFRIAGAWGLIILTPLYWLFPGDAGGPAAVFNYAQAYYGFLGVTIAWQLVFFVIASSPATMRPLMPVAILEKVVYVVPIGILAAQGRLTGAQAASAVPDFILGSLFVAAYVRTAPVIQTRWC